MTFGQCCQSWCNCIILVQYETEKYNGTTMANLVNFQIIFRFRLRHISLQNNLNPNFKKVQVYFFATIRN